MSLIKYSLPASEEYSPLLTASVPGTGIHKIEFHFAAEFFDGIDQIFLKIVPIDGLAFVNEQVSGLAVTKDGDHYVASTLSDDIEFAPNCPNDFGTGHITGTIEVTSPGGFRVDGLVAKNSAAGDGVAALFHLVKLTVKP